jgi:electron transport complex protein RnfA
MGKLLVIFFGGVLLNNFVLSRFLGICPFIGISQRVETAAGMSAAVVFVMALASVVTWFFRHMILVPFGLEYLQTIGFILIIATLVQLVEMVIQKTSPPLYQALGIYLPLITTNCAVLGVTILNVTESYNLLEAAVNGVAGAAGFALAILLFAAMRERMELSDIPESLKGFPIALITAGLMSMAFLGFAGFRLEALFGVM